MLGVVNKVFFCLEGEFFKGVRHFVNLEGAEELGSTDFPVYPTLPGAPNVAQP